LAGCVGVLFAAGDADEDEDDEDAMLAVLLVLLVLVFTLLPMPRAAGGVSPSFLGVRENSAITQ
jgi:hypothetical protein